MLVIGIAGGTGSGKTTVVRKIMEKLPADEVAVLSQDSYYRDNGHLPLEERQKINFDHPDAIEFDLLVEHLQFIEPFKRYADLIVPQGGERHVAINILSHFIQRNLS